MKKAIKISLIISLILVVLGIIIGAIALLLGGRFEEEKYIDVTHEINGAFEKIEMSASSANISIKLSENGKTYAVCAESEKIKYEAKVEGEVLTIKEVDTRKWYEMIGIFLGGQKSVTLYLPSKNYGDLSIIASSGNIEAKTPTISFGNISLIASSGNIDFHSASAQDISATVSSGNVRLSSQTAGNINIAVSSGDVNLQNMSASSLTLKTSSGRVNLSGVITSGKAKIATSSGNITILGCDAGEFEISSSSGDVKGTILTGKNFDVKVTSGDAKYPASITGGLCKIRVSSGDVDIKITE